MKESNIEFKNLSLFRFKEHSNYNQNLNAMTLFPYVNVMQQGKFYNVTLNLSFKKIDFNKKKVLPFFLALELITGQKCVATLSSKNILMWKLRKGMLVGCKVTLRKNVMENFFDSLLLALPRMENLKVLKKKQFFKNKTLNFFSFALTELFSFYAFELGLGISTEVQKLDLNFIFSTTCVEEKLFLLCSKKIPII